MVDYIKLSEVDKESSRKRISKRYKISFKKIFYISLMIFIISLIISSISLLISPKIAVVPIKGVILTQDSNSLFNMNSVSSRDIALTLKQLKDDDSVKAVLLDINSPGGSPVASDEISRAIEDLKTEKPVYVLIDDIGASGAFWVSVSADKIYASPMSTIGSIGVTSAGLSFENFIKNYNITYRRLVAGKYKDIGTPYRAQTEEEKKIIQNMLDDIHRKFINHVAKSRNLSYDYVSKYATGEIFLGDRAKEIGFIDELGYYPDVIKALKNVTNNDNLIVVTYGEEPSILKKIGIDSVFSESPNSYVMLK